MKIEDIAIICHEANRAICQSAGDTSQRPWQDAFEWQRQSAVRGVRWALANPDAAPSALHEAWMADRAAEGWVFGPYKDAALKQHPCMVPYSALHFKDRVKDHVFRAIVAACKETG